MKILPLSILIFIIISVLVISPIILNLQHHDMNIQIDYRDKTLVYRGIPPYSDVTKKALNEVEKLVLYYTNKERALYEKLKKNPNLDLTKYGTEWIEAIPINRIKTFKVEIRKMI